MIGAAAVLVLLLDAQQTPAPRDARPASVAPTGRITGVVVSDEPQPRPLRRARVVLSGGGLEMPLTAITADDGAFVFEALPAGRFTITASKDAYVSMAYGARRTGRPGTGVQIAAGQSAAVTLRLPRGAVITGTILDVDGRPAAGVSVYAVYPRPGTAFTDRVWSTAPGTAAAVSDDRGVYRIYGLAAGEYLVSAIPQARFPFTSGPPSQEIRVMLRGNAVSRPMTLAPVLHPGVADVSRAARVLVRAGEERGGIDVQLEYVPLATVSGTVAAPAGWAPARVTLWRTDDTAQPPGGPVVSTDEQGRFTFRGVSPGNYRVAARITQLPGSGRGAQLTGAVYYGAADVAVAGDDVDGLALSLQPGLTLSGRIVFETDRAAAPALPFQLRINPPASFNSAGGNWPMPPVVIDGATFRIEGLLPGPYRMFSVPQGIRAPIGSWWLKSISAAGRELLDTPIALLQSVDDAVATFTDRASELAGTVRDRQGASVPDLWIVAYPVDRSGWFFNSRRIAAARSGRNGEWSVRNLPPGEYRVAATDLEQNEWFDPAVLERLLPGATPLRITGPEKYTVDLVLR